MAPMAKLTTNILVPTDFSQASVLALEAAALLAEQNEAKVTLVHIYNPQGVAFGGDPGDGKSVPKDVETRINAELRRLVEDRFGNVKDRKTVLIVSESPAKGIVAYAEKEDVDMIVMTTHGRTGLKRMMIGSVAERVVRHAPCPVLTLRSKLES